MEGGDILLDHPPIRDPFSGKLLGWQEKSQVERRFKNYPSGSEEAYTFRMDSNLHVTILVESPLDCVSSIPGVNGGVSTFGVDTTPEQVELLGNPIRLSFALDNDDAGKNRQEAD